MIHGVIYKVRNLCNDKNYIGKAMNFSNRKSHHLMMANKNKGFAFHHAIRKYGEENFEWEIIDYAYSDEELSKKRNILDRTL